MLSTCSAVPPRPPLAAHSSANSQTYFRGAESLRRVFAGMAVAPTCWCISSAVGYQMKSNGVSIPGARFTHSPVLCVPSARLQRTDLHLAAGLVGTGGMLLALVAYIGMFLNSTKFNTNLWLYSIFIGGVSAYAFQNAAETETTHHKVLSPACTAGK